MKNIRFSMTRSTGFKRTANSDDIEGTSPFHFIATLFVLPFASWAAHRYFPNFYQWIVLILVVFAVFQYGRYKYHTLFEDLNKRWNRHILSTYPKTPLEPCEWLNNLLVNLWPGYIQPKLSLMFSNIIMKRFKEKKPQPFRSIELQNCYLGNFPPRLGGQRVFWSTESDEQALHMGFEWDAKDMNVLLAATLAGPFKGTARFVINGLYVKGDLRIVPILDGQAFVYSFTSRPEVRISLAFGGGGQSLPATELPLLASWLEKLLLETIDRTMVEPQRKCFPLPPFSTKKHATGGVISVTVVSAENLHLLGSSKMQTDKRSYSNDTGTSNGSSSQKLMAYSQGQMASFVEVTLEDLTRNTQVSHHDGSPVWNDSFHMVLHETFGTIHFNVYEHSTTNIKDDFQARCQVKVRYVDDGSTIFWTCGPQNRVLADRAENCGKEITMAIPIIGCQNAKLIVKLLVKEWQFKDESRASGVTSSLQSYTNFGSHTGRTVKVTVVEGRNLAAKDRTGKSDPYVRLRYGKMERKTKTIKQDLNPVWKQEFEFPELEYVEHLHLKCYDLDYFNNDESLGRARVNLTGLRDGDRKDVWVPLEKINTGEIRLIIEVYNSESDAESIQNGSRGEYGPGNDKGVLEVNLIEARDLVAADMCGTSDPFVLLQCGSEKYSTKILYKTLQPCWNETFKVRDPSKPLKLHVKDHNDVLPDTNIGHCTVEYDWLPKNQTVDKWIPLQGVRKGEIHVKLTRQSDPSSNGTINVESKLQRKSQKVKTLLKELKGLTDTGDTDLILKKIEDIEILEQEKIDYMSRIVREKDLLLGKIKELEKAFDEPLMEHSYDSERASGP